MTKSAQESREIVVVGGGIIGCSIAYHLAKCGLSDVLVLERTSIGSGATGRAAALLTRVRPKPHQIPLIQRTYAAIRELQALPGDPMGLRRTGSLHLAASAERLEELRRQAMIAGEFGLACRWIDPGEAERLAPWLCAREASGLLLMPEDSLIDPYLLAISYQRAARIKGVVFRQGVEATGLLTGDARVQGVRTTVGPVRARWVVDATGAWVNLLSREAGVRLPCSPVRSHYWVAREEVKLPAGMPYVVLPDAGAYIRPELEGLLVGLREPRSLSVDPRSLPADLTGVAFGDEAEGWAILIEAREKLARFFPDLDQYGFTRFVTGLSTYTPDGDFVIGPTALEGYLVAAGCCGAGIAASGGFGFAIAALLTGHAPGFALEPHRPDRFGSLDPLSAEFQASCAAARSAKVSG